MPLRETRRERQRFAYHGLILMREVSEPLFDDGPQADDMPNVHAFRRFIDAPVTSGLIVIVRIGARGNR